jgi:hypothetical protein
MVAASVAESFNRRIRVPGDVWDVLAVPIIVRLPRDGALTDTAAAAEMLAVELLRASSTAPLVLVAGVDANPEHSGIAAELGKALATDGRGVLVIDAGSGSVGRALGITEPNGLADVAVRAERLTDAVQQTRVSGMDYLGPGSSVSVRNMHEMGLSTAEGLRYTLDRAVTTYHHVVVGGAAFPAAADLAVGMQAHGGLAVLVAAAGRSTVRAVTEAASALWLLRMPLPALGLTDAPGRTVAVDVDTTGSTSIPPLSPAPLRDVSHLGGAAEA